MLMAAWSIVLLIAFFSNRGEDVGRLSSTISNLGGGPLFGSGIFDSMAGAAVALVIFIAWLGLGSFISIFLGSENGPRHSHVLELSIKAAMGAAAWSLIWFLLGTLGLYSGAAAVTTAIIGTLLGIFAFKRTKAAVSESRIPEPAGMFDRLLLLLAAVPVGLSFIASLAPPTAKDTLLYHFSVPKQFIAHGSNAVIEGNIASYLALGTEMHSLWAMLLGGVIGPRSGEAAAGAVIWLFFPLLLAAVFGFAREIDISRRWSLIAVLMAATVPTAYHVAANAYIDIALAFYILLATYSLTRWWKSSNNYWLLPVAIFLGAALSAKLTTLFVIAAFALVILFRVRKAQQNEPDNVGKLAAYGFGALLLAGLVASPWYLRTFAATGSPIFPFYMNIWEGKASGWDIERSNLFQMMNSQYGGYVKTPLDYLLAPWNLSVTAQPEIATHFDGVLGVAFLAGLPLLLFVFWKLKDSDPERRTAINICVSIAAAAFLFWLFSSQQLRYLLPIVPLLAIAIAAAGQSAAEKIKGSGRLLEITLTTTATASLLVSFAWFAQKAPLRVVLGGEAPEQYLTRNLDYFPYYEWLNSESAPEAKVWLINMRRDSYNLQRPYFSDYLFEDWTLKKWVWESGSAAELREKAKQAGLNYVLTRHDFLFDYDRTPLVDDKKPRAENEEKLRIARDFVLGSPIRSDQRFSLVKVF